LSGFLEPFRDHVEWLAALLGLLTVVLVVRRSTWNYPFALAMVSLYFFEFLGEKLYSDALLQIFFFAINVYGWWAWSRAPEVDEGVEVTAMAVGARSAWFVGTAVAVVVWGFLMARFTDAAAPFVDAAVAGASVAGQWLQSLRRVESWLFWILADVIAIPLYWWKGLVPTTLLYVIFLGLAVAGLLTWRRAASPAMVAA
jgi:nicotinamide mononucleotide transporter